MFLNVVSFLLGMQLLQKLSAYFHFKSFFELKKTFIRNSVYIYAW